MIGMLVGYKLVDANGAVIQQWGGVWGQCPSIPNPILLPNGVQICGVDQAGPLQDGYVLADWWMEEPLQAVPAYISRRQAATQLRNDQYISQNEALAMASSAAIPPFVQFYFNTLDPVGKADAELAFTAIEYPRSSSLLTAVMEANGLSSAQIDQFFISAAKL